MQKGYENEHMKKQDQGTSCYVGNRPNKFLCCVIFAIKSKGILMVKIRIP